MESIYCGEAGDLLGSFLLKDLHQFVLVVRLIPTRKNLIVIYDQNYESKNENLDTKFKVRLCRVTKSFSQA